jgi:hypothetical protein
MFTNVPICLKKTRNMHTRIVKEEKVSGNALATGHYTLWTEDRLVSKEHQINNMRCKNKCWIYKERKGGGFWMEPTQQLENSIGDACKFS